MTAMAQEAHSRPSLWSDLASPSPEQAARFYAAGWWRKQTFVDDLAAAVRDRGEHTAIVAYQDGQLARSLTYAELGTLVARYAAALTELGVSRGSVVALHLPNRWQLSVLYLACHRIGAIIAPLRIYFGVRELGHALAASQASVCVTVDRYDGADCAARLADAAPATLRHQVILGGGGSAGTIDFDSFFTGTAWEERHPLPGAAPGGPDDPSVLLFSSGTTGQPKGVVHSANTLYAAFRGEMVPLGLGPDDVLCSPHHLAYLAAMYGCYMAVMLGATHVMTDPNADMGALLDAMAAQRVSYVYAAPALVRGLLDEQRAHPRDTSSLRLLVTGSAPIPAQLPGAVREVLGVELRALWGMTENGCVTITRADDPPGWAAHSDGSPVPWMDVRVEPAEDGGDAGRLLIRGASMCLGYLSQPDAFAACFDGSGWFDTGDLARSDGRGGIKLAGRRSDWITRGGGFKIPVLEVEAALLTHPAVAGVVLVGYPDAPSGELAAAVVVPVLDTSPPDLDELRQHLAAAGMTRMQWPDRLIYARELPMDSLGKVQRGELQTRLAAVASPPVR
jgi:cyclohexanecarboxylate-CoA ligase